MLKTKPKQKPVASFTDELKTFGDRAMQKLFSLPPDWYKNRNIVQNNCRLGARYLSLGSAQDAVLRFKLATWFDGKHASAWAGLGRAYLFSGKRAAGERALQKALECDPANDGAKKILAAIPAVHGAGKSACHVSEVMADGVATLAALHPQSFRRAWTEKDFTELLAIDGTQAWMIGIPDLPMGFIVGRSLAEQYEIITIAVNPEWRGHGLARRLLDTLVARAEQTATQIIFLEVAEGNDAARRFYESAGFAVVNRRKDYYRQEDGSYVDALIMRRELT